MTECAFVQLLRLCVPELKYVYKMRSVDRQYMCAAPCAACACAALAMAATARGVPGGSARKSRPGGSL